MKKSTNREAPAYDDLKLKGFTAAADYYAYKIGAAVVAEDGCAPDTRKLGLPRWFVNGAEEQNR